MALSDRIQNFVSGPAQKGSARYFSNPAEDATKFNPRGRLKPSDFDSNSHTRSADLMVENFLKVNWDSETGTDSFRTKSFWDSPDKQWIRYEDPTILSFRVFFDFISESSPLLLGLKAPGDNLDKESYTIEEIKEKTYPNSALRYLMSIGELDRARYLLAFQSLLKRMSQLSPWFFQSLEGLDEAWKHGFEDEEFKSRIGKERKITINTLDESIDLRITALIDFYRKACFDWLNRREMVPKNLRMFSVKIYIHEARSINKYGDPGNPVKQTTKSDGDNQFLYTTTLRNYNEHTEAFGYDPDEESPQLTTGQVQRENTDISRVLFYFYYCEWMPDESVGVFTGLSNKELGLKSQKLVFNYGNVHEINQYRLFHDRFATDAFVGSLEKLDVTINPSDPNAFDGELWPKQPALDQSLGVLGYLKDKAVTFAKNKAEQLSTFLFGGKADKIGRAYPPSLIEVMMDQLGLEPTPASEVIAKRALAEAQNIPGVAKVIDGIQAMFMGNVYGFSAAKLVSQVKGGIGGMLDAANIEGIESNASLRNDKGPDSKETPPMDNPQISLINDNGADSKAASTFASGYIDNNKKFNEIVYGGDKDPSKANDKGFDATLIETGNSQASLTNDKGPDSLKANTFTAQNEFLYGGGISLNNDKGPDSSETLPVENVPSLTNDNGPDSLKANVFTAQNEFLYGGGASLAKDKGPDSKDEAPVNSQASLKNDKGPDSKDEAPVNPQGSLSNDKGSDASNEAPVDSQSSLKNDKGFDASNEAPVNPQGSLSNDKGSNASNEAPVDSQASLKNDKGPDAKGESPVDSQSSLKNDKGMDSSNESPVDSQSSLKNDKGMDASNEAPVDSQASLKNDKGPDAKGESPVDSQSSLKNDNGPDANGEAPVDSQSSLKNDKGPDANGEAPVDSQSSLRNDKGSDASNESPVDSQSSLRNDKGSDASNESPVNPQSSLKNDNGPDSKDESPVNSQSSLKNDKGSDSKDVAPVDSQSSLRNDKGMDSTDTAPGIDKNSLNNYNGPDAKDTLPTDPNSSLKNDKGPDSTNTDPGKDNTSLSNNKSPGASDVVPGNPLASLLNDKGPDSSETPIGAPNVSLKNDNGTDAKGTQPGDDDISMTNG